MSNARVRDEIESLENKFWQSMIDRQPSVATAMLTEPALMVSGHGSHKFDHDGYTKMAADERFELLDYKIADFDVVSPTDDVAMATYKVHQVMQARGRRVEQDVFDTSTWVRSGAGWRCVMHTESQPAPRLSR